MKLFNWEFKRTASVIPKQTYNYKPTLGEAKFTPNSINEQFKGKVVKKEVRMPKDLGEEHLFKMEVTENLYKTYGMVTGVVDKYIDFLVGPGFFIVTENEKAKQLIDKFLIDNNFDSLLRAWVKEALIKGTGYLEMAGKENEEPTDFKILDSKWMYIKRDDYGETESINQLKIVNRGKTTSSLSMNDFEPFKPFEVAVLPLNIVGDNAYGLGIVSPALLMLNQIIGLQKDMHMLMHRKATTPIHAKLGSEEFQPRPSDVTAFGQEMETLNNRQNWATDWLVDMKVLDFGNIGEKFDIPLKHDEDMLFFTFQVPEVIMGRGNIPEGLAEVQIAAFQRRIESLQSEIEKVIETKIFKRILNANGLDVHVEFQWGQPSTKEKNERVKVVTEILKNPMLDFNLRSMLEKELAELLELNVKELETDQEERDREETVPLPIIPGENRKEQLIQRYENFVIGNVV